ncbi:AAA family ATPase [Paraliomyxa miuraensis]|uniref:AAA family ATPase n=1 Tax=Paraliomyxa miuraensis TaxID=376150 RepID=UPI00225B7F73|nr:MoxR family ATPase [Paraliomyxa miuraensis]MCX4243256.1 MoxR family ATPase [Paraliomyxa miuraensis]
MTSPGAPARSSPEAMRAVKTAVAEVIRGKDEVIELVLIALCAGGHVLLEDLPGVGKSTLARAMAAAVGAELSRIQFTADLLPADIIGVSVWRPQAEHFEFRPGPVFGHFVLADEVNRAPPRTQSALLEAMGEAQVSVEGQPRPLPQPFMVIATQNPSEHHGTYPLPESQRDRFALRVTLGYASAAIEAELLQSGAATGRTTSEPVTTLAHVQRAQAAAAGLYLHPDLAAYAQRVVQATREHAELDQGVSTRGALAWVATARARAWLEGREQVSVDDLQTLAVPTLAHRVVLRSGELADAVAAEHVRDIVARIPVPR